MFRVCIKTGESQPLVRGWPGQDRAHHPGGLITEFAVPGSGPEGIITEPDGNLWFTDEGAQDTSPKIGRITTAGKITEFPLPSNCGSAGGCVPYAITAGPDGALWFTEVGGKQIGRITTAGSITAFPVGGFCTANKGCGAFGIASGPDGNLWATEYVTNNIARITTVGIVTVFHIPTANSKPRGIAAGPDGNVWFTEQNASKIGRITTS